MADTVVNITAGTGTPIRVLSALGAGPGDQQVVTLADPSGNLIGALTKGTQGAAGISTQDLKDAGRTAVVLSVTAVASTTTETGFSFGQWKAGTASTGVASYTVTTGKTFRLQSLRIGARFATPSTTATFASAKVNLRAIATGTYSATASALLLSETLMAAANVPTADTEFTFPDGLEFGSGYIFGLSHIDSAATLLLDVTLVGYEY